MKNKFFNVNVSVLVLLVASTSALASDNKKSHWGYSGHEGPEHWGELSSAYKMCSTGKEQSPIDIKSGHGDAAGVSTHYNATALDVVNNGHTIQVNYAPGSTMSVGGHTYSLLQFHFHSPSENTVDGHAFPMEMHFVHADDHGTLAVVGVMFKEGHENATLKKIWDHMPAKGGDHETVAGVSVNGADFIPHDSSVTMFRGSLTTPPCSEGVKWNVMDTPVEASKAQINKFLSVVHENARPVQALNGRKLSHGK